MLTADPSYGGSCYLLIMGITTPEDGDGDQASVSSPRTSEVGIPPAGLPACPWASVVFLAGQAETPISQEE